MRGTLTIYALWKTIPLPNNLCLVENIPPPPPSPSYKSPFSTTLTPKISKIKIELYNMY
jgi:hypothetical protein